MAADPVKALASLAVEPMEVLLGGGEDNYDDDIYIYYDEVSVCLSVTKNVSLFHFLKRSLCHQK